MDNLLFRCSSLYKIMAKGKDSPGLTDKQAQELEKLIIKEETKPLTAKQTIRKNELIAKRDYRPEFDLSAGAKTYVKSLVKQFVFDYEVDFDTKETAKGNLCEDESIELYNHVNFTKHIKNEASKKNAWIKGTCDIDCPKTDFIKDIKTSWSKETFPATAEDIDIGGYEWQGRGYMMLYDRSRFELVFCLVSTPIHLLHYEKNMKLHFCEDIEPELRLTSLFFNRCKEKEEEIKYRVGEARKYANWYENQIIKKY